MTQLTSETLGHGLMSENLKTWGGYQDVISVVFDLCNGHKINKIFSD